MSKPAKKQILAIGLAAAPTTDASSIHQATPEYLQSMATAFANTANEAGFEPKGLMYRESELLTKALPEVEQLLQKQKWDGLFIGFGIRGSPELTVAFERLVNLGRMLAPQTPMGFNTKPDVEDMMETFKRAF